MLSTMERVTATLNEHTLAQTRHVAGGVSDFLNRAARERPHLPYSMRCGRWAKRAGLYARYSLS